MRFTILTPTYNRASLLSSLYKSLVYQSFKDFEWIVIDDGSNDNTKTVIENFINEDKISIRLIHQKNGGKHRALNRGVKEAKGELLFIVDSDDSLPIDSLERVSRQYEKIKNSAYIGGVCGLMAHHDGTIIGTRDIVTSTVLSSIEMRFKYGFKGDLCEVFRTSVLRAFPFPEIGNEVFCPEDLVLNRIATDYKLLFFNEVIYSRDYLDGGLTSNIIKIRMKSPIASMMCYAELLPLNIPFVYKLKAAINYWRFRLCYHEKESYPKLKGIWNSMAPLGFILHMTDSLFVK